MRGIYRNLTERIKIYNQKAYPEKGTADLKEVEKAALSVKELAVSLGMHRELGLDSVLNVPYTEEEILKIENLRMSWRRRRLPDNCTRWGFHTRLPVLNRLFTRWQPIR